jgi:hypothetical protein
MLTRKPETDLDIARDRYIRPARIAVAMCEVHLGRTVDLDAGPVAGAMASAGDGSPVRQVLMMMSGDSTSQLELRT